MTFEFESVAYPTREAMLAAIAAAWITAGGRNSAEEVDGILAVTSDDILAETCIEGWALDQPADDADPDEESWMALRGIGAEDLVRAFATYRAGR